MTFSFPSLATLISADPSLRLVQGALLFIAALDLYLLFWTLRDILLRTRSFLYQIFSLLLVTAFPLVGFLAYLLARPPRTLKEREIERLVHQLLETHQRESVRREKGKRKQRVSAAL